MSADTPNFTDQGGAVLHIAGKLQVESGGVHNLAAGSALQLAGVPVHGNLREFNLKSFGAVTDGVTDDMPALTAAYNAAVSAGGGTVVFPTGTTRLIATTTAGGLTWHLGISASNLTFRGEPGASVKSTVSNARLFYISGSAAVAGFASWSTYDWAQPTVTARVKPMATAAQGAMTVTLQSASDAATFAVGDYVVIRTGDCLSQGTNPDAEINKVMGIAGAVLTLRWPLTKPYAQEYYATSPGGGYGVSSTTIPVGGVQAVTDGVMTSGSAILTSVTGAFGVGAVGANICVAGAAVNGSDLVTTVASRQSATQVTLAAAAQTTVSGVKVTWGVFYAAPFGVAKVTDSTLTDIAFRDLKLDNSGSATQPPAITGNNVIKFTAENLTDLPGGLGFSLGWMRFCLVRHCTVHLGPTPNAGGPVLLDGAIGMTDIDYSHNHLSSETPGAQITLHEGMANVSVTDNTIDDTPNVATNASQIDVRARGYNITIARNRIYAGTALSPIYVDATVTGGGAIFENDIILSAAAQTALVNAITVLAPGWEVDGNNGHGAGLRLFSSTGNIKTHAIYLSGWLSSSDTALLSGGAYTRQLGTVPIGHYIRQVDIFELAVWNAGGGNTCDVGGKDGNGTLHTQGLLAAVPVGSGHAQSQASYNESSTLNGGNLWGTGLAGQGDNGARTLQFSINVSGGAPSTGATLVVVECIPVMRPS